MRSSWGRSRIACSAFGNTVAASYLRLVPGQEAPTQICWGYHPRSSLVRVPLDFSTQKRVDQVMNPEEKGAWPDAVARPTVEYRTPEGFSHRLFLSLGPITDEAGRRLETDVSRQGPNRQLRIWVPGAEDVTRTITSSSIYRIPWMYGVTKCFPA